MGSLVYSAPEVLQRASDAKEAADVYSLAMTAIVVLSGRELGIAIVRYTREYLTSLNLPGGADQSSGLSPTLFYLAAGWIVGG
jgi:serine/threonine protein kinase